MVWLSACRPLGIEGDRYERALGRKINAVHLPDYKMVQIPLGTEWKRSREGFRSTFTASGGGVVMAIEFPKAGCFGYQLAGSEELKVIEMSAL